MRTGSRGGKKTKGRQITQTVLWRENEKEEVRECQSETEARGSLPNMLGEEGSRSEREQQKGL